MRSVLKWLRRGVMAIGVVTILVIVLALVIEPKNDKTQETGQSSETKTLAEQPASTALEPEPASQVPPATPKPELKSETKTLAEQPVSAALEPEPAVRVAPVTPKPELEAEPGFQIVKEKDSSFGNIRSRVTLEIVSPEADDDRSAIIAMMATAIERHRQTWPDAVSVRLWLSSEMNPPIRNRIVFAPDGCGWAGTDCNQGLWTDLMKGTVPSDLMDRGRPDDQEKEEAKELICRQSLQCWGDKHNLAASFTCQPLIEAYAKYDYEWTDGFLESKLPRFRWNDRKAGTLSYKGDKIKFQNGFGAWQKISYWCHYDPNTDTASVSVHE